jgi:hypothetical protein
MLATKEVSSTLQSSGIKLNPDQVAELARNQAFPKAYKDDKTGNWVIPVEDVTAFIHLHKRKRQRRWITAGAITFIITVLGLLSITKDTVDLLAAYVFPTPTMTATVTPTVTPPSTPTSTPTPAPIGKISAFSPAYCCIVTVKYG